MLQKVTPRPVSGATARKSFHLYEILSLVSGLPLAQEGSAAVHRLVAFMMEAEASSLNTTANAETVKQCLEEQLPFLKELNMTGLYQIYRYNADCPDPNPYLDVWLEMQALRYGEEHALMPFSRWQRQKAPAAARVKAGTGAA
jgi:hypothetical protein